MASVTINNVQKAFGATRIIHDVFFISDTSQERVVEAQEIAPFFERHGGVVIDEIVGRRKGAIGRTGLAISARTSASDTIERTKPIRNEAGAYMNVMEWEPGSNWTPIRA